MKNNQIYQLSKEHIYHVKIPDCPLNIAISCDGSNAIIATTKKLTLLYFRKLFNREKAKKILKQEYCDIYKNIGPIQMHPFFDEKEYFAGAYENNLFVIKVSKNTLNINEAKKFSNQHYDNIKHIAWQNRQNGFLVSSSTDKLLNFYDIRSMTNPIFKIKDDDIVQSLKFANANFSNLAAGYNKRLKIWDLKRIPNKTNLKPFFDEPIFNGNVNILDWHSTQNYLLAACSSEKTVKIYSVKEKAELLISIFLPNFEEANELNGKMLKSYFIPGNGIIIVKEKRAFIFVTQNNYTEAYLDLKFDFEIPVTHFKIMTNNLNNQYFVYTDKENNFIVRLYTINENICKSFISASVNFEKENRGLPTTKKNVYAKEVENLKRKFATISIVDNKLERNTFIIRLSQDLIIQINLKVIFPENYPNEIPSIEILDKQSFLIPKYLINNITQKLSEWEKKLYKNNLLLKYGMLEDLLGELMELIEKSKFVNTFGEQEKESTKLLFNNRNKNQHHSIIPYPKTCSFTWNPNGQLLTFGYHKIDFNQLKQTDKIVSNFNDLDDWVKYCKSKDYRNNKFSKSENKLFEEENNIIIYDKLRDLIDWKSMIDSEENAILNSINRIESLPNLFMNNVALDIQQEHFAGNTLIKKNLNMLFLEDLFASPGNNNVNNYGSNINAHSSVSMCNLNNFHNIFNNEADNLYLVNNENKYTNNSVNLEYHGVEANLNEEKRIYYNVNIYELESFKNKYYFLENIKIRLLSKDYFLQSIKDLVMKIDSEEASVLLDIIKLIDYNIDSIIDKVNTKKTMIKFYKNSIMTTLKSLEKNRNFEFLYLCILLIISRMRDDIDKFNENLIRMASNKSIYQSGNINIQNSPTKISELTLDFKKTKSNNLNNINSNDYFNNNNLSIRNLANNFENFNNYQINSSNTNNKTSVESNPNKRINNQFKLINQSQNESSKTLDTTNLNIQKDRKLDYLLTNQFASANNETVNKIEISRASTMNNNTNLNNFSGSNYHLINGYTNINRISPNINSSLTHNININSDKIEANSNNLNCNYNKEGNFKKKDKYITIKDYFENNESKNSGRFIPISNNYNSANNEKIALEKNQSKNITNYYNDNLNSYYRNSNDEKSNNKYKDNDISNYFSKKFGSNKKLDKKFSLLNLRKAKETDIDRESIFSIRNNLKFDYNKSPKMNTSKTSSGEQEDIILEKNEDGKSENLNSYRNNEEERKRKNSLYNKGIFISNLDLIGNSLGNRKGSKVSILSEKLKNTERNMNILTSISRANLISNSNKGEKLISNKNSAYDFPRTSSYEDENNPANYYDNYNISELHKERASPDFLLGENLIDTKIPIHYQSPPNGLETEQLKRNKHSNSNTNIDNLNYSSALNFGNYLNINVNGFANGIGNNEKYSNKTVNSVSISKNDQFKEIGCKNNDYQSKKKDVNNIVNKSFLGPNTNSIIPNQIIVQSDLVSNYSQNLQNNINNIKSNPHLNKNENNIAYNIILQRHNVNKNTLSSENNNKLEKDHFPDDNLDLKYSNSNNFPQDEIRNKLFNEESLSANDNHKEKQLEINVEKSTIKKRNLVKIFGKSIISKFIDFLYHYSNELLRKKRMMERAELIKFLYLISTKLEIKKFNSIFQNTFNNFVTIEKKQKTSISAYNRDKEITIRSSLDDSYYNRLLAYIQTIKNNEENDKEKIFKTNIMKPNKYSKCDICGERIRVDELSIYNTTYNMGGHFDHIINFINAMNLQRIYNK